LSEEPEVLVTGVPRSDDFGKWKHEDIGPQYPDRYAATTRVLPRRDGDIPPEPAEPAWEPILVQVVAPDEKSGHRGTVIEGEYAKVGIEVPHGTGGGRVEGGNLRVEYRWGGGSLERTRTYAAELVALKPDVIFGAPASAALALYRESRTIPVVFAQVADPVGVGLVDSLARPGGNITGFAFRVRNRTEMAGAAASFGAVGLGLAARWPCRRSSDR
jgi:hypothetical protein